MLCRDSSSFRPVLVWVQTCLLLLASLTYSQSAHATDNIVVCGNTNWGGIFQPRMDATRFKLMNPANFGPSGIYGDYTWTFIVIGTPTTANLNANNCDMWFSGYDPEPDYSDLPAFINNGGFVVGGCDTVGFDAVCNGLGITVTNITNQVGGYVITDPPNYLTCDGLVNNPNLGLNTAGGASSYFNDPIELGVYTAGGQTLVITDSLTSPGYILTGDIDLFTTNNPEVTGGPNIITDQDKFIVNSFKVSADTISGAVAENGLPDCADISDLLIADLSITKDDGITTAAVGFALNYTINVANAGPESSGDGLTLVDILPNDVTVNGGSAGAVTLGGANAASWSCNSDAASPQQIDCDYVGAAPGIPASGSSEIIITTDPLPASVDDTNITNNVEVFKGAGYGETDFSDNTAFDVTAVSSDCTFGGGTPDPLITAYLSDEARLNGVVTRAATDTFDDAWRIAVGQPAAGQYVPWFGFPSGTINLSNFEPDFFDYDGTSVDLSLVNMDPVGDCNGTLNTAGNPQLSRANTLQSTSPRPESLYTPGTQPGYWRESAGSNTSRNAAVFEFDQPVSDFGLWIGDFESRTDGQGEAGYLRLLNTAGQRIGQDIAIAPSGLITSTSTSVVDQDDCGNPPPGIDQGCGSRSTRWVGFVDSATTARVKQVVLIIGDDDNNGNAFAERMSFIGANVARDYSDAPASFGTPSHYLLANPNLYLGANPPDAEGASLPSAGADADDLDAGLDDEDAITGTVPDVVADVGSYSLQVSVTNTSGANATLVAWIDFDGDGAFQNDERTVATVTDGVAPPTLWTLIWASIPPDTVPGDSYLRLRMSSDAGVVTADQDAVLVDGEVEDHPITIIDDQVDLTIAKSVDDLDAQVGQTVTFTLKINNLGPSAASSVVVTDIVPAGFSFVPGSMTGGNTRNESAPTTTGLQWTINTFAANGPEVELTFQAVLNPV